ncbi:tryptophan halogenase PrnA [Asticcacaulis biprosthecium C19]|uniref:Tryptophan halogenase PrnA n=1 Tax=Asticcacaulis biprosthecium C19 TaxID=715226 RepID=F4QHY6_9CAUL|nr:tryptophan halogenase family protein [Asticcacaulis biprosthecium]EGF91697.1 tryptophan halogenase PrnA [Asticcacaulis biprosthecium C19]
MQSPDPIRSIVIVGGGTAGWMAAAAFARNLGRHLSITLVESEDIGTVGVGEATIPPIKLFNAMLGLDEAEFMRETRATYKLGIRFHDWRHLGQDYFHPFGVYGLKPELGHFLQFWLRMQAQGHDIGPVSDYSLCTLAALQGRMGRQSDDGAMATFGSAYHFDAGLYARYLRRYSQQLGVIRVEGLIADVQQHPESGNVQSVRLKDGRGIAGDLFIDCSGFRGLLIEQTLGTGYDDWSHWLPCDRAMAMPCAHGGAQIQPYTSSTAREGGWQWHIPLQHRVGNGYVYSSRFVDDDTAEATLRANLEGEPLAEPNRLRFQTGRRKKFWNKNVVALGLASGFIEPLESTSIHLIQSGINKLLLHFPDRSFAPANIEAYNRRQHLDYERIRDFIILHYHATARDDSGLWRYTRTMEIPDSLAHKIEVFRERGAFAHAAEEMFTPTSWMAVMMGQGIIPQSHDPLVAYEDIATLRDGFARMKDHLKQLADTLPTQHAYLKQNGMLAIS